MTVISAFICLSEVGRKRHVSLFVDPGKQADPSVIKVTFFLLQLPNTVGIQSHTSKSSPLLYYHKYAINVGKFKKGGDGRLFSFWQISFKSLIQQSYKKCHRNQTYSRIHIIWASLKPAQGGHWEKNKDESDKKYNMLLNSRELSWRLTSSVTANNKFKFSVNAWK